ncbi:MAG: hypothetical protein ACFB10_21725 [Salibacteraceae bacterium]
MMKVKIALLLLLGAALMSSDHPDIKSQLIGKWKNTLNEYSGVEYREDGRFYMYVNGQNLSQISNLDSLWFSVDAHKSPPEVIVKNRQELLYRKVIRMQGNELACVYFKSGDEIDHHIGKYGKFYREGTLPVQQQSPGASPQIMYILPQGFRGKVMVIHDESNGVEAVENAQKDLLYTIPNNGLLRVKSSASPFKVLDDQIRFYETQENGNLEEIDLFKKGHTTTPASQLCVKINGYNRTARDRINASLDPPTHNNIFFFTVDTPHNLRRIKNYPDPYLNLDMK